MGARVREDDLPAPIRGQGPQASQPEAGGFRDRKLRHVKSIVHGLPGRRRPPTALHQVRQVREGDQEDHLPVLRQPEDTIAEGVRGNHRVVRRRGHLCAGEAYYR